MYDQRKWWQKPLRAVTLEFPASNVAELDLKGIINETADGAVNTLVIFATGYYPGGTAFYQSKIAPHYPGLGDRDLLSEAIELGHKNGQKIIVYMASIWGSRAMYEDHPDWAQRKANSDLNTWDEALNTVAMCPNSPYRDYFNSLVLEISNNYNIDGFYFDEASFQSWCNCKYCQRKFNQETGFDLITVEDWNSPLFKKFIRWRYTQISTWRKELYDLAKKENRCILFQGAFPLGVLKQKITRIAGLPPITNPYQNRFGVEWPVPLAHGTYLPDAVGIGDVAHFELYRVSIQEPLWWYGVALRYGQSFAKQKQILTLSMMGKCPFDLYGLSENEIRLSIAEILANGGAPIFARYYPDRVDQEAWDSVYKIFKESKLLDSYVTSRESMKYVAVFFSQKTSDFYDQKLQNPAHLSELKGISKALLQSQTLFDVITEDNLDELDQYKVLVLPNTSYLAKDVKNIIKDFVRNGGGVVASYESGMYNEAGKRTPDDDLAELFGISYTDKQYPFIGFDVYMKMSKFQNLCTNIQSEKLIPTGGVNLNVEATTAEVVAEVLSGSKVHYGPLGDSVGSSVVLMKQKPEGGRVVYFALPIGNRYLEFGVLDHFKLINAAVRWAAKESATIQVKNAPHTLAVTAFTQIDMNRQVIHLVNSVRDEVNQPILELNECRGVQLCIKIIKDPVRVIEAGKAELNWSLEGQELIIDIPDFDDCKVIVIEY